MTCSFCGRENPPGGLRDIAQVSNPVTYRLCCRRWAACYLAALGNLLRGRDA